MNTANNNENVPKDTAKDVPNNIPKKVAKDILKDAPKDVPKDAPKDVPKDAPKDVPKDAPEGTPKTVADDVPNDDMPIDADASTSVDEHKETEKAEIHIYKSASSLVPFLIIVLPFLTPGSIVKLSAASNVFQVMVSRYTEKLLLNMIELIESQIGLQNNFNFWYRSLQIFFSTLILQPINRFKYLPTVTALLESQKSFPVSMSQCQSFVAGTLDKLKPHHIRICDHNLPQPHTCHNSKRIQGPEKTFSDVIVRQAFIQELKKRVGSIDSDELLWLLEAHRQPLTPEFVVLLFDSFLSHLEQLIKSKALGHVKYIRTEYLLNLGHRVIHRIWLQIELKWTSQNLTEKYKSSLKAAKKVETPIELVPTKTPAHKSAPKLLLLTKFRPMSSSTSKAKAEPAKSDERKEDDAMKDNSASFVYLYLTIYDHFLWDS